MIKKILHKLLGTHPNAMSFQNSMDLAELPVITFHQGSEKINFILDTGSNVCVIDASVLDRIKYSKIDKQINNSGIEGSAQNLDLCIIETCYKDKTYENPYAIRDMSAVFKSIKDSTGVTVHGLLGSDFFNKYKYVLDFKELIAYSKE